MIQSFYEYQKLAMKTAVYPNIGSNLAYPVLGLIDEMGEADSADEGEFLSELSDCYWYLAACYSEASIAPSVVHKFYLYNDNVWNVIPTIAGIAKKAMRDNDGIVQSSKIWELTRCLGVVHGWLDAECADIGVPPLEVMQYNLDKLADRQNRGVIKGDGDYR